MHALPIVESPLTHEVFDHAIDLYRLARRGGITVRSSVDWLIAACAIRHGFDVMYRARDFTALEAISTLRSREV